MFTFGMEFPLIERLKLNGARTAAKGGKRARIIIIVRTKAGKDVDGKPLPKPRNALGSGQAGPTRASGARWAFYRTGETVEGIKVFRLKRGGVKLMTDGYHSEGKAGRAIAAIERSGKTLSEASKAKIRRAAGKAAKKRKGMGGKGGKKGGAKPLPAIMYAIQAGAVGGKPAGARAPAHVMDLNDRESSEVTEVMASDVVMQTKELEADGSVFDFRNVKKVAGGSR